MYVELPLMCWNISDEELITPKIAVRKNRLQQNRLEIQEEVSISWEETPCLFLGLYISCHALLINCVVAEEENLQFRRNRGEYPAVS